MATAKYQAEKLRRQLADPEAADPDSALIDSLSRSLAEDMAQLTLGLDRLEDGLNVILKAVLKALEARRRS